LKHVFACGLVGEVPLSKELYEFAPEVDLCSHYCPDPHVQGDVNNCPKFLAWARIHDL